jgi:hypothetical protein
MSYKIKVGKWLLQTLDSVVIAKSVLNLSDTATIKLPAAYINKAEEIEDKISVGDGVEIWLGYDNDLKIEFKGYLKNIATDGNSLNLQCEDELYKLRVSLKDKQFSAISLKQLLDGVIKEINGKSKTDYKVVCDYKLGYEKFTIFKATGIDVLKKVQDETKANIYFKGNELHIHPVYSEIGGSVTVRYDFAKNIEHSELKYVLAKDKNIEVEVIMTMPDGKQVKKTFGSTGGEKKVIYVGSLNNSSLKSVAENHYSLWNYDGYEGGFTGWLIPYVEPTYKVSLRDENYKSKDGVYYVTGVETAFSASGGSRKITLGKRLQ